MYCPIHAYYADQDDPKDRVCCIDCADQYITDKKRIKILRIIVGVLVSGLIILLLLAIIHVATSSKEDESPIQLWNSTLTLTARPPPLIDDEFDPNAQAEEIALALNDAVNAERRLFKRGNLEWKQEWFNIANGVAKDFAAGRDIKSDVLLEITASYMHDHLEHIDADIEMAVIDARSVSPL